MPYSKHDGQAQLRSFSSTVGPAGMSRAGSNAIAVVRGMAEPEMCIPYMRRLAQQRTDRIIETSPNGVVILDSELSISSI